MFLLPFVDVLNASLLSLNKRGHLAWSARFLSHFYLHRLAVGLGLLNVGGGEAAVNPIRQNDKHRRNSQGPSPPYPTGHPHSACGHVCGMRCCLLPFLFASVTDWQTKRSPCQVPGAKKVLAASASRHQPTAQKAPGASPVLVKGSADNLQITRGLKLRAGQRRSRGLGERDHPGLRQKETDGYSDGTGIHQWPHFDVISFSLAPSLP